MKWLAPLIIVAILLIFGAWYCTKSPEAEIEAKDYEIKIYDFNKNTGYGHAYLKPEVKKEGEPDPTVRIEVEKYNAANQAKTFTGSAHEDTFIKVKGKLTSENGHPVKLTIPASQ
jgi:hypothetical protein